MNVHMSGNALTGIAAILVIALCVGGCAPKTILRETAIDPSDAEMAIAAGDELHIVRKDREFVTLTVKDVNDREIVGEEARVSISDIESITHVERIKEARTLGIIIENAAYLLILWPFFVF